MVGVNTCLLTVRFSTASIPGVIDTFHVSQSTATLGLSLYVIGYGIGPIIFSPLSEIPSIGRRPIYIITLLIFVALQVPTLYANNIHTLLAMRFFAGFFGSPALATGGASIQDMYVTSRFQHVLTMLIIIFTGSTISSFHMLSLLGALLRCVDVSICLTLLAIFCLIRRPSLSRTGPHHRRLCCPG